MMRISIVLTSVLVMLMVSACSSFPDENKFRYKQSEQHPVLVAPEGVTLPERGDRFSIPKATAKSTLEGDEMTRPPKLSID